MMNIIPGKYWRKLASPFMLVHRRGEPWYCHICRQPAYPPFAAKKISGLCVTFLLQEASKNPAANVKMVQNTCIFFSAQMKILKHPQDQHAEREKGGWSSKTNTLLLAPPLR